MTKLAGFALVYHIDTGRATAEWLNALNHSDLKKLLAYMADYSNNHNELILRACSYFRQHRGSKIRAIRFRSFYDSGCMADIVYAYNVKSVASEGLPRTARDFLNSGNVTVSTDYDKLWGFEIFYTPKHTGI